jgi:hypothetical protein
MLSQHKELLFHLSGKVISGPSVSIGQFKLLKQVSVFCDCVSERK